MEKLQATGYLAPPDFEAQLRRELRDVLWTHGRLILAAGPRQEAYWVQNVWLQPVRLSVRSVSDAARQLRDIQRNWALYSVKLHRRASLVQEQLPHVSARPLVFPSPPPRAPMGSWTLLDRDTVLASPLCSSPFVHGEPRFVEFKEGPPNRAYLKLWEALTIFEKRPREGERCLDAGASPGGWTWALSRLGARVLAVDRSPLDARIGRLGGVEFQKGSAFSVLPGAAGPFDWIFSDVVCYPERLWQWVKAWLDSGSCRRFVCTLKFQGSSHYQVIREFASVPGSRLVHLSNNKHELTWLYSP